MSKPKNAAVKGVRLLRRLPCCFESYEPEALPEALLGATIVAVGTRKNYKLVPGGGLWIDYRPAGSDEVSRLVLAFDEVAMWVAAHICRRGGDVPFPKETPT
jgi:hypothetical protein